MKTINIQLKGTTLVDIVCDCGTPVWLGKNGYYCPRCNEQILLNFLPEKDRSVTLCEKALWGLLHANPVKAAVESSYNHGYRIGWKECQKLGIDLIERVITELKQP